MSDDTDTEKDMDRAARIGSRNHDRRQRRDDSQEQQESQKSQSQQTSQEQQTGSADSESVEQQESQKSQRQQRPEEQPVTERRHDTYYLRDDLRKEVNRLTVGTFAEVEATHGVDLDTNRHRRPLLLLLGAERLAEMDDDEILSKLVDEDVLDDPTL
ncbi:hypothetical protein [Haloarcula sp. CBA1127]|uniref:hypothetical protein n=1 Tax=Haloarcula sp. CBA1127 TaxID=1765055 RepID=UPI00073E146C|nr:hypothetical protein [Haloarcula sp. CBA1127]